ncbi:unnamed protein product, partial [Mycena citricolor]
VRLPSRPRHPSCFSADARSDTILATKSFPLPLTGGLALMRACQQPRAMMADAKSDPGSASPPVSRALTKTGEIACCQRRRR